LEPMVFSEGKATAVAPMSGEETIEFPPPVGEAEAFYTLHSEVAMFPRSYADLKDASFKVAFEPDFTRKMRFLVELGFASRESVGGGMSPREMLLALAARQATPTGDPSDCDILRVEVSGRKAGERVMRKGELTALPHPTWKVAAGALDTGVPLSIVGQMLARGTIATPGVLCPETAVPAELFFRELSRRGMHARLETAAAGRKEDTR